MSLQIVQLAAGQMDNFSYLVYCPVTRRALGVDPSFAPAVMLGRVRELELELELLINTHGHRDHCAGNEVVLAATGARLAGHPLDMPEAEVPLGEGRRIAVGEGVVEVLHTPGHTPGSITLHPPGALITGDTLFVTRCGRADLAGSDVEALYQSLRRLAALPPETLVYPGHDYGPAPTSTIGYELEHNPYLQCPDLPCFIRLRLG
ncbi:MAG: MBL fold metallo-hydrolase [Desulfuromonadaceae bacterium]|jgi:hydroxyacylglutathione hydrolase